MDNKENQKTAIKKVEIWKNKYEIVEDIALALLRGIEANKEKYKQWRSNLRKLSSSLVTSGMSTLTKDDDGNVKETFPESELLDALISHMDAMSTSHIYRHIRPEPPSSPCSPQKDPHGLGERET